MNHYYTYLLRQLMERNEVVSIYSDENHPDDFMVGYIEKVDAQHYLICEFAPWGEPDAYRVRRTQDVLSVLYGEEYEERIRLMLQINGRKIKRILPKDDPCEDGVLLSVLQACRERREIVSLILGMELYCGRVKDCNGLYVTLEAFDFFGRAAGEQIFELRDIDVLQFRSGEEEMYRQLEAWHASRKNNEGAGGQVDEDYNPDDVS